jgi:hypothetical protein
MRELSMDWVVGAGLDGEPAADAEGTALAAFREHGCVLLRGVFAPAAVEAMHRDYVAMLGDLDHPAMEIEASRPPPNRFLRVGPARYDITVPMTGAFGAAEVFANKRLLKLLGGLLGDGMQLSNFTLVVAHPGAGRQNAHRDNGHLFDEPGVGPGLPVYAVNVAVPLIDVDLDTGPTGVWLGSHRLAQGLTVKDERVTASALQRGDCILLDYRTMHAGLPNHSAGARPIVYMVYTRPWFFDHVNHIERIPLDMPINEYNKLPQSERELLIRARSYAARARWQEVEMRGLGPRPGAAASASPVHVGRRQLCPCGSGKKYKHCHGRAA